MMRTALLPLSFLVLAACDNAPAGPADIATMPTLVDAGTAATPDGEAGATDHRARETAPPDGEGKPSKGGGGSSSNGIDYHGGAVMLGTTDVYYIWYGTWTDASERAVLTTFADNIGGSAYFGTNTTYTDGTGTKVSNDVVFAGETDDAYSQGTTLSDAGVQAVVSAALASGALPTDPNGVYFVLTSADVSESSGFCSKYCGWHSHGTLSGTDIKYAFVGDADRCLSSCAAQTTSPNGYPGADAMASIVAHELEEAVTDPDLNAWYDRRGQENADKCAWTFGTTYTSGGAKANMNLGGLDYLVQQNWVNASGGYCSLK